MQQPTMISREDWSASQNRALLSEPEWWKKTRTYEVQVHEGNEFVTKMTSDTEWVDDFRLVARNPYARILKNKEDVTAQYRDNSSTAAASTYTPVIPVSGPEPAKKSSNATTMKPAAYKALPLEEKQELWNKVQEMLQKKMRRNDIFQTLNLSESTYDVVRLDLKSYLEEAENTEAPQVIAEPAVTASAFNKVQRPGLLKRR